jgi:hypothetical protein
MIMWRNIRPWASLCGHRALQFAATAGLADRASSEIHQQQQNAFQIDLPQGQLWTESRYYSFWFWGCLIISRLDQTVSNLLLASAYLMPPQYWWCPRCA